MVFKIVTVLVVSICLSIKAEFPDDPKPCKYEDNECILTTINFMLKEKSQGDDSLNLPPLNPLKFDVLKLHHDKNEIILDLILTNNSMYGLDTVRAIKVKGFSKDLTAKHSLRLHADYLSIVSDYQIDGKILILPIKGNGKLNITLVDVDIATNFVGTPVEKDGATYLTIEELNVEAEPKGMLYKVGNLFNGDQALDDNMNLFLNDNWQEIYREIHASIAKTSGDIFKDFINKVFSKYPYDKYFIE